MERRQVLLVDAFADGPTGGRQVPVVPDGSLSRNQRVAIAREFSTGGVVTHENGEISYTDVDGSGAIVSAAVAGFTALSNRGLITPSTHEFYVSGDTFDETDPFIVDLTENARVTFELPTQDLATLSVGPEELAETLGIDVATLKDVGADLPAAKTESFGGSILVPINFLEHLTRAAPSVQSLASLLESEGVRRLIAFTFDTLEPDTDVHARIFDPDAAGNERPASGVGAGAVGAHLGAYGAFDGDKDSIQIECGRVMDRPGRIGTTVGPKPIISGSALTVLDAALGIPVDSDDDDIIEV